MNLLSTQSVLNTHQQLAIETTEGFVRVVAGAGSGKTKTLAERYLYLVTQIGIEPENILCVTFTNKAAHEMKARIRKVIGELDGRFINTFHAFCVHVLKAEGQSLGLPSNFLILDREDMKEMLHPICEDLGLKSKHFKFSTILDRISQFKSSLAYLEPFLTDDLQSLKELAHFTLEAGQSEDAIVYRYLYEQRKSYALDFDDLIALTLHLFQTHPEVAQHWQMQFNYLMVDEFQDIDQMQYQLVALLSQGHHNLFVVGDPDQTIYTWRGAKVEYILEFNEKFLNAKTIFLNQNYRSNPAILTVANELIKHNQHRLEKELIPYKTGTTPVKTYHGKQSSDEAAFIAQEITSLHQQGVSLKDIAILYRSHYISRPIEEALIKAELPYTLFNGVEFYKRKEIKDLLAYLRLLVTPDDVSFNRIINTPRRSIGPKRLKVLRDYSSQHHCSLYESLQACVNQPLFQSTGAADFIKLIETTRNQLTHDRLSNVLTDLLANSGYESLLRTQGDQERLDNLAEMTQSLVQYESEAGEDYLLQDYLHQIALFTDLDKESAEKPKESIKLMTIHTAKGLEFEYVFVCGLNEGVFPTPRANTPEKIEEERRVAYVAYTRAKEGLYLTESEGETFEGSFRYPSRFLLEISPSHLEAIQPIPASLLDESQSFIAYRSKRFEQPTQSLSVGDQVHHQVLGKGQIQRLDPKRGTCVVQFESLETTRTLRQQLLTKL